MGRSMVVWFRFYLHILCPYCPPYFTLPQINARYGFPCVVWIKISIATLNFNKSFFINFLQSVHTGSLKYRAGDKPKDPDDDKLTLCQLAGKLFKLFFKTFLHLV